jgi:type IV secretion system protein VirB1
MDYVHQCAPAPMQRDMWAIVQVESGANPTAIAIVKKGFIAKQTKDKELALNTLNYLERNQFNYSVGYAQINKVNFQKYNASHLDLLDPCKNTTIGADILKNCQRLSKSKDPDKVRQDAYSCYYSGNIKTGYMIEPKLGSSYVQRVNYYWERYAQRDANKRSNKALFDSITTINDKTKLHGNIDYKTVSRFNQSALLDEQN